MPGNKSFLITGQEIRRSCQGNLSFSPIKVVLSPDLTCMSNFQGLQEIKSKRNVRSLKRPLYAHCTVFQQTFFFKLCSVSVLAGKY